MCLWWFLTPLAAAFFLYLSGAWRNFVYKPSPGTNFFAMFTVWHGLFSLTLMFPRLRIEVPSLSTVQGNCMYIFFKAENQEIQFLLLCTKPSKDKHKFLSLKAW